MNIEVEQITNGFQKINRITFTGADDKSVYVDLWDDEMRDLKELITQNFTDVIE